MQQGEKKGVLVVLLVVDVVVLLILKSLLSLKSHTAPISDLFYTFSTVAIYSFYGIVPTE